MRSVDSKMLMTVAVTSQEVCARVHLFKRVKSQQHRELPSLSIQPIQQRFERCQRCIQTFLEARAMRRHGPFNGEGMPCLEMCPGMVLSHSP